MSGKIDEGHKRQSPPFQEPPGPYRSEGGVLPKDSTPNRTDPASQKTFKFHKEVYKPPHQRTDDSGNGLTVLKQRDISAPHPKTPFQKLMKLLPDFVTTSPLPRSLAEKVVHQADLEERLIISNTPVRNIESRRPSRLNIENPNF